MPPTAVATIGSAASMYSITESGLPSKSEEQTARSSAPRISGTSVRSPRMLTLRRRFSSSISRSRLARSGPSPTISSWISGHSPVSSASARSSTWCAFCGRSRPTTPINGASGAIASSALIPPPAGAGDPTMPIGMKRVRAGSMRSISVIRRRSSRETATNASAPRAITSRSTKRRSGWPS